MLSGILITLFTTEIKLSWESQPIYDISLFHVGAEAALIFLTSGDFTRKFCSRCCVCMRVQIKWWGFERALLCKTKMVQLIHYPNSANKMRIFCCNTLANREKNQSPLPCKGPCNVLQLALFTLSPCCHMLLYELGNGQGNPCCAGPTSFLLWHVVVPGCVLPEAPSPLSAHEKMGLTKFLLRVVKFWWVWTSPSTW